MSDAVCCCASKPLVLWGVIIPDGWFLLVGFAVFVIWYAWKVAG
jgi:hypothetical protein